jgi:putative ABC transport system ATP-binding protein
VWDLLAEFGLAHRAMAYPAQSTQGEMVRAALAVALVNDPAVLLVDEPTAGLDGDDEELVIDGLLRRVARGLAVLVASRSEAVLAVADRNVTLDRPTAGDLAVGHHGALRRVTPPPRNPAAA